MLIGARDARSLVIDIYRGIRVLPWAALTSRDGQMDSESRPRFESYFGAAMFTCGITWFWDYVASLYFPGQTALNLTLLSATVYLEAALIGAFGLTRRISTKHIHVGIRVGLGAWMANALFRLVLFELGEALWGVVVYLLSFIGGGVLGGLLGRIFATDHTRKS